MTLWEQHQSPDGVPYYFCKARGESRWSRPVGPMDRIVAPTESSKEPVVGPVTKAGAAISTEIVREQVGEPETWESIGRTGWLRVETDRGFKYFFHKKTKRTAWSCPKEIEKEVAELDGALAPMAPPSPPEEAEASSEVKAEDAPSKFGDFTELEQPAKPDAAEKRPAETGDQTTDSPAKLSKEEKTELRQKKAAAEQKAAKDRDILRNFKQMMIEKKIKPFDKYEKWLSQLVHDPRFTAVQNLKERKILFEALAKRIDSDRRKQVAAEKRTGREVFKELLTKAEEDGVLRDANGKGDVALRVMDRRFGADDRWDAVGEKERERMVAEATEEIHKRVLKEREESQAGFRALLQEAFRASGGMAADRHTDELMSYRELRKMYEDDPRWKAFVSSSAREQLYDRVVRDIQDARRQKAKRARQDELEAEQARKRRKTTENEEGLLALFTERLKTPFTMTWEEAKGILESRELLSSCGLSDEEQERLFEDYRERVTETRRQALVQLLVNTSADIIGPEMELPDVLGLAVDSSSAKALMGMPEDVVVSAFEQWREHAYELAAEDCRKFLKICQHFRGTEDVDPAGYSRDFDELVFKLAKADVRVRRLAGRPELQRRLVSERLEELRELRAKEKRKEDEEDETVDDGDV